MSKKQEWLRVSDDVWLIVANISYIQYFPVGGRDASPRVHVYFPSADPGAYLVYEGDGAERVMAVAREREIEID